MSSKRLVTCSLRPLLRPQPCIFCQSHQQLQSEHRYGLPNQIPPKWHARAVGSNSRRYYATQRLDVKSLRTDVDKRNRVGFYTLTKTQGILKMEPHTADSIIADFLHQRSNMDHGSNIQRLAKKYQLDIEDLSSLAIVTFMIPDLSDPNKKAMLPPSQHKTISSHLLQGCAQAEDPLAIIQVLSAVHLSTSSSHVSAKEIARFFSQTEIAKYRKTLEKLATKAKSFALGPDALTLQGLLLEREGHHQKAKELLQEAVLRSHLKFNPKSRHPMQLQLTAPWNALGFLLKADKDTGTQAEAKKYFEQGAREGDDPLSCYELSAFEPRTSTEWLRYTSKAAASGHRQAMVNLADFYQEANSRDSAILKHSSMRKALNWLLSWRRGSAARLAQEWLQAAANTGHKPSMLKLVDQYEAEGEIERAKEQLRQVLEPPSSANQVEEWPQLVHLAKKRLAGVKT